jgi:predicted phosphodiesterase
MSNCLCLKATVAILLLSVIEFARAGAASTPEPKVLARVALLSDPHVNRATNGMDATFRPHFEKAIAQVNAAKVDLVLIAGDLTQDGKPEECADFKMFVKQFRAPVFFVPGNHDVGHKFNSGHTNGTITTERVAAWERTFGPSWFAKKRAGVRVLGINSSLLGSGFEREKAMWKFLEGELAGPGSRPTILFMHYPLFLKNPDEPGGEYFNTEPAPRARLLHLLEQGGVKIVLTGHTHRSVVNRRDGILFLTTPPISFGLPRGKQPEGWTLVTIFKNGEAQEVFQPLEKQATAAKPTVNSVDLRPQLDNWGLEPRKQGSRPTCSVFAFVGALEFAIAETQQSGQRLSVEFLNWAANQTGRRVRDGGFFSDMWKGFSAHGICAEKQMPYQSTFDPSRSPLTNAQAEAKQILEMGLALHWIKKWNVKTGLTSEEFARIKETLSQGRPVCGGLRWPKRESWKDNLLQMCPPEEVFDGHSVLFVGYRDDDQQPGGGVFIFRNSNRNGRDGLMPFAYAQAYLNDAAWIAGEVKAPSFSF